MDYQNPQMDKIEIWLTDHGIYYLITWLFSTLEFIVIDWFILNKRPRVWYYLTFYLLPIPFTFFITIPPIVLLIYPIIFYTGSFIIETSVLKEHFTKTIILTFIVKLGISILVSFTFQLLISIIKSGTFKFENTILNLSSYIVYELEYLIALSIVLYTIALCINTKKGGNKVCHHYQEVGGSSQTSMKQLQKSNQKTLTKTQKNKLYRLYIKMYIIQISCFLTVMILPFILNKVFEFLIMYFTFIVIRYLLGFKYSLHYVKESTCFTVAVLVFGVLTLVVPFFSINIILAILLGTGLAILLHLSYKYKGLHLYFTVANKDRHATLYVFFNGNIDPKYIAMLGKHYKLSPIEINILVDYMQNSKLVYLSKKYNYSERQINNILDNIVDTINSQI
jgi:hypothetical protein